MINRESERMRENDVKEGERTRNERKKKAD